MQRQTLHLRHPRALGPGHLWIIGLVLQALLGLTLTAGPRAASGPLHWHSGGADRLALVATFSFVRP